MTVGGVASPPPMYHPLIRGDAWSCLNVQAQNPVFVSVMRHGFFPKQARHGDSSGHRYWWPSLSLPSSDCLHPTVLPSGIVAPFAPTRSEQGERTSQHTNYNLERAETMILPLIRRKQRKATCEDVADVLDFPLLLHRTRQPLHSPGSQNRRRRAVVEGRWQGEGGGVGRWGLGKKRGIDRDYLSVPFPAISM